MNILFICKHNVFRSKVAEAYFKKINKNKNIKAVSAGILQSDVLTSIEKKMVKTQKRIAKEFGIKIKGKSKPIKVSLLRKIDLIIIVANDVSKEIFDNKFYLKPNLKVIQWKISDVKEVKNYEQVIKKSIKEIIIKVESLVKKLENAK